VLAPILDNMIKKDIVRKYGPVGKISSRDIQDVITDFLIHVFQHTKRQLELLHGFSYLCHVQFVLTVPTICKYFSNFTRASSTKFVYILLDYFS